MEKKVHWPGIEPGPPAWQARILPLNHQCLLKEVYCFCILIPNVFVPLHSPSPSRHQRQSYES